MTTKRGLVKAALTVLTALLCNAASAQDCWRCPDVPALESATGYNLYWHGPGAYWEYGCDGVVHTDDLGCPPSLYGSVEAMPLFRDSGDDFDFAGSAATINTSAFSDEFAGGGKLLLGYSLSDWYRIEGSVYGAHDWSDTVAVFDGVNTTQISFSSELTNVELNLRRRINTRPGPYQMSFFVGGRYMSIQEEFSFTDTGLPATNTAIATGNELLGLQLGLTGQYMFGPKWWVDVDGRVGLFANDASQTTVGGVLAGTASQQRTSVAGDLSVMLNWQCASNLTLRIGWYANWVTGLALAANNSQILAPNTLDHSGRLVYHGPMAGLVWTFGQPHGGSVRGGQPWRSPGEIFHHLFARDSK